MEQDKIGPWRIIPWDIYINMTVSNFLTLTHCIHTKMFLLEVRIILTDINVTFDNKVEEIRYDPEEASNELGINED